MTRLTHSSMSTFRTCNRRYRWQYDAGIRPKRESAPLRIGGNCHLGFDARASGLSVNESIQVGVASYAELPKWVLLPEQLEEWAVEREIVASLLSGYFWLYGDDQLEVIETEQVFDLSIVNPETGRASKNYAFAGKIDKIARLPDGRCCIVEHKTTGESIDPDSDYWRRLRLDQQISGYYHAAWRLCYDVQTVLYDVVRKPSIRPKLVKGTRENAEQFGERLRGDIAERPEFYFARREIPRLQSDLEQFEGELWAMTQIIRLSETKKMWPRNTAACIHPYRCTYLDICDRDPDGPVPDGFVRVEDVHVELMEKRNDSNTTTAGDTGTTTKAAAEGCTADDDGTGAGDSNQAGEVVHG